MRYPHHCRPVEIHGSLEKHFEFFAILTHPGYMWVFLCLQTNFRLFPRNLLYGYLTERAVHKKRNSRKKCLKWPDRNDESNSRVRNCTSIDETETNASIWQKRQYPETSSSQSSPRQIVPLPGPCDDIYGKSLKSWAPAFTSDHAMSID